MKLEVCFGEGLVLFIDVNSLGMIFSPSVFLRQDSLCSPARSRVRPCVFSLIPNPQGAAKDVTIWAETDASATSAPTEPPAVAEETLKMDPLGFCMEFLPFPTEASRLVVVKLSVGRSEGSSRGRSSVWPLIPRLGWRILDFLGDIPHWRGRAGQDGVGSTSLGQRTPWNTRCCPQQDPLA